MAPGSAMLDSAQQASASPSASISAVLACENMLSVAEFEDAAEREGLKEDVREECEKFGRVLETKVPLAQGGAEAYHVLIRFEHAVAARAALTALSGRNFDGRTIAVRTIAAERFEELADGDI